MVIGARRSVIPPRLPLHSFYTAGLDGGSHIFGMSIQKQSKLSQILGGSGLRGFSVRNALRRFPTDSRAAGVISSLPPCETVIYEVTECIRDTDPVAVTV